MNPRITIISEGIEEPTIQSSLEAIPDLKLKKIRPDRGLVESSDKAMKFVAEFIGGSTIVADFLLKQVTNVTKNMIAPCKVMVKIGETVVEVENANRSQLIEILDKAKEIAEKNH